LDAPPGGSFGVNSISGHNSGSVSTFSLTLVYFVYGLAFFTMGVLVMLEGGRASDQRLRHALRPLAAFGIVHGLHEWLEMFALIGALPGLPLTHDAWEAMLLAMLSFSFLSLSAFGASLLSPTEQYRRISLVVPILQVGIWGAGLLVMRGYIPLGRGLWEAAHAWTRYVLAIPASLLASAGLVAQQRAFRRAGMAGFSRDSLWAAVAFAWYGLVGQLFTQASLLWPSNLINEVLFLRLFGFPVQLLRAATGAVASVFVMRFLRAFEVETQRHIAELQAARVEEAERREAARGELLRRVVAAQEAERQRIARELHDATGQSLTALGLGLRGAATALHDENSPLVPRLRQLEALVAGSLDELRRLIADLRPSHLDDLGLPAALRWYGKEVHARTGLEVQVEVAGETHPMSPALNIALFRIAQEALTNVVKHARATQASVRLRFDSGEVRLEVTDNGRGFVPANGAEPPRQAWGLLGMQERAELVGGHFQVTSRPGEGTHVVVVTPYQVTEADHDHSAAAG
jgi:signal transduction histidine kinase